MLTNGIDFSFLIEVARSAADHDSTTAQELSALIVNENNKMVAKYLIEGTNDPQAKFLRRLAGVPEIAPFIDSLG